MNDPLLTPEAMNPVTNKTQMLEDPLLNPSLVAPSRPTIENLSAGELRKINARRYSQELIEQIINYLESGNLPPI
jgi:hypothetical protein